MNIRWKVLNRENLISITRRDLSPVTEIDQETETRIRKAINDNFPDDSIEGEEHGIEVKGNSRNWVIDPIDGTKNFLRGVYHMGYLDCALR